MAMEENGHLTKLSFTAYKTNQFTQRLGGTDEYSVMYNPEELTIKLEVESDNKQGIGTTSSKMEFRKIKPQDYRINFWIDGTGVTDGIKKDVPDEVENFLRVVYDYNSAKHRPNFVMILYGAVLLKTVLRSVEITYNLFSPNGKPLRAKLSTVFTSCLDPNLSLMINNPSSPDLTHKRVVSEGEKLVQMANKIYQNNLLYADVAQANGLNNFRTIEKGTAIWFPPVKNNI